MADADESMMVPDQPAHGVLGTLWLVAKKTGEDMQSFPIDAERVTIGRDWDSDIRLYFSDVSKLHCELKFDAANGQASLHVHGSHGLKYAPHGSEFILHKPPAIIPLSDKDMFVIRKKHFRFEYGHQDAQIETPPKDTVPLPSDSPVRARAPASPLPRRKRSSYRMSLVPSGKPFEPLASPMKSRRHSIIGLGDGPQVIHTPKKSGLSKQIEEDEEEEGQGAVEEEAVLVEAHHGEEGDVLYIEQREEDVQRPIHQNPFMTPQQARKAPIRNTSAVARTRKQVSFDHQPTEAASSQLASPSPASPKTPRSVPLPAGGETPYASNSSTPEQSKVTPRSVPLPPADNTPYKVPAQVALSTPRGPFSLHKALLVRSARKRWESDQAQGQGIEGAIEKGNVSIKRKSLSPIARDSRKSLTPMPDALPPSDDEEEDSEEEDEDEDEMVADGELQWIYENGTRDASVDESDSSLESFEADMSMEIPGQGVISFTEPHQQTSEDGSFEHEDALAEDEEEEEEEYDDDDDEAEDGSDLVEQMGQDEEDILEEEEDQMLDEGIEQVEMEDDFDQANMVHGQTSTPVARPLNRFYTPQPQRSVITDAPRTLASIGGPAVRFQRPPETPSGAVRRIPATPGSLGAPSRRMAQPVLQEEEEDDVSMGPSTPIKREIHTALLEEAKRRRETLGTPRNLPAPPSSFKTPVRAAVFRPSSKPAPHPALEAQSPDQADDEEPEAGSAVPMTPVERIERKLKDLRRQSMKRQTADASRRATVGFALPATPARSHVKPSAAYTTVGTRRAPEVVYEDREDISQPSTPTVGGLHGEDDISVLQPFVQSPEPAEVGPSHHDETQQDDEQEQEQKRQVPTAATPQYSGMKEMFRSVLPPKTPSFAGMKSMFAAGEPSKAPATPHYNGMKTMFQEPAAASTPQMGGIKAMFQEPASASTPQMAGLRNMYQLPQEPPTPAMDGLGDMYEIEEVEQEAALQPDTDSEEEEQLESTPGRRKSFPKAPTVASSSSSASAARATSSKPPIRATSSRLPTASAPTRKPVAAASEKKAAVPAPTARKTSGSAASRARATTADSAPKRAAAPAKKAATAPVEEKPRPGDLDDCSTEHDEPLEYDEPVKPKAATTATKKVSRSAPTRTKPAEIASGSSTKEPAPRATRGRKAVLGENDEQPPAESSVPVPALAKATRAKKATATATSTTTSTTAKAAASTSAPTRRTRTVTADKENEPESEPVVKKAPARRTVKKTEPVPQPVGATTTRTTRSRK